MNGDMWVESALGEGSKFYFTIQTKVGDIPLEVSLQRTAPFRNLNVLLLDSLHDDTGVATKLEQLGLRTFIAHDIESCSPQMQPDWPRFDAIVLDEVKLVKVNFIHFGSY